MAIRGGHALVAQGGRPAGGMLRAMDTGERAYLSILGWPDGFDEHRRVEAMVSCAGMAPFIAGQMARRATPAIVHLFDSLLRDEVLGALHGLGVLALAPTRAEVSDYPRPVEPREVQRFGDRPGAFAVHTRDGGMWSFHRDDVRLIVPGTVRQAGRARVHAEGGAMYAGWHSFYFYEGMAAAAMQDALRDREGGWGAGTSRNVRAVEVIDIHLRIAGEARLLRLSGATTRIGAVGETRARPSLLDEHRPIEALQSLMPNAPFELGFAGFNTPSDVEGMANAAGQGGSRLNPVAFHFYSVWSALIDRGLNG